MSKPISSSVFVDFTETEGKKCEVLMQVLEFLNMLKSGKQNEKLIRFSGELTEILESEKNIRRIQDTQNLEELLDLLGKISARDIMFKVRDGESLKKHFPQLARNAFL